MAKREHQIRQNVKDMQEAMDRLNAMSEEQRRLEITKRQVWYAEFVSNHSKAECQCMIMSTSNRAIAKILKLPVIIEREPIQNDLKWSKIG